MCSSHGDQINEAGECEPISFHKEMGISLRDFLRLLPAATASTPSQWERNPEGINIVQEQDGRCVRIEIGAEQVRRIASLSLPVLSVSLYLSGFNAAEAEGFIRHFDRHYQRGGG